MYTSPSIATGPVPFETESLDFLSTRPRKAARVLVADDDDVFRSMLVHLLRQDGHNVTEVKNGAEVLVRIEKGLETHNLASLPDVIVMDHVMPGMTGFEILEGMGDATIHTPVILISGWLEPHMQRRALEEGAMAVYDKMKDLDTWLPSLRQLVSQLAFPD